MTRSRRACRQRLREPKRWHRLAALSVLTVALASRTGVVAAQSTSPSVSVRFEPIFTSGCVPQGGATEYLVTIENPSARRVSGTARIESAVEWVTRSGMRTSVVVPFTVAARGSVVVHVPAPAGGMPTNDGLLRVEDGSERVLFSAPLQAENPATGILIDASPQGRLATLLRAGSAPDPYAPTPSAAAGTAVPACAASRESASGAVVLPRHRVGYNGVALVVIDGATLMNLPLAERVVLADWVAAGGTLAIVPSRVDELRHPTLEAFVGAGVRGVRPRPVDPADPTYIGLATAAPNTVPRIATVTGLDSFAGGNLHTRVLAQLFPFGAPDLLGATASYGFGEVHVLSINPTMPPALEDPWVLELMRALARQARSLSISLATLDESTGSAMVPASVRRLLDPNEGFRSGLAYAVVLLIAYAILAGPVSFRLGARRGKPQRGLLHLPLYAAGAFVAIVLLGGITRGFQGRARRMSLIEVQSGFSRGSMRRYHGYYSGTGGHVSIEARGHDRRLYADPAEGSGTVSLALERDGCTLRRLPVTPWSTAVVREQGFESLGGSITLQPDFAGRVRIVNRLPHAIRHVLVVVPAQGIGFSFARIARGETRLATSGTPIPAEGLAILGISAAANPPPTLFNAIGSPNLGGGSPQSPNDSLPGWIIAGLFGGDTESARQWTALLETATLAGPARADEPVLTAILDTGAPSGTDGGLNVERDVTFVRVLGWGGAP